MKPEPIHIHIVVTLKAEDESTDSAGRGVGIAGDVAEQDQPAESPDQADYSKLKSYVLGGILLRQHLGHDHNWWGGDPPPSWEELVQRHRDEHGATHTPDHVPFPSQEALRKTSTEPERAWSPKDLTVSYLGGLSWLAKCDYCGWTQTQIMERDALAGANALAGAREHALLAHGWSSD